MSIEPFRFADACEILAPYLVRAYEREAVRQADARREADRTSGVTWSGFASDIDKAARSAQQLREEAAAALDAAQAFALSPRGRFLASLETLEQSGHGAAAERARAAFARGFSDPQRRPCPAEIGTALTALARLEAPDARDACVALSELLTVALSAAAE